ncbi:MAG: DUF6913 domain-containing protein [Mangrovibacterium sp.]
MKLKDILSNSWLKSELKKQHRSKEFVNIKQASSLGIIWQQKDLQSIIYFKELIGGRNICIKELCLSEEKTEYTYSRKDFSFLGKPKKQILNHFVNEKLDILLDFTRSSAYEVRAIVALSNAKFKVGSSGVDSSYFDLNIQITDKADLKYLIEQTLFYLEVINNSK